MYRAYPTLLLKRTWKAVAIDSVHLIHHWSSRSSGSSSTICISCHNNVSISLIFTWPNAVGQEISPIRQPTGRRLGNTMIIIKGLQSARRLLNASRNLLRGDNVGNAGPNVLALLRKFELFVDAREPAPNAASSILDCFRNVRLLVQLLHLRAHETKGIANTKLLIQVGCQTLGGHFEFGQCFCFVDRGFTVFQSFVSSSTSSSGSTSRRLINGPRISYLFIRGCCCWRCFFSFVVCLWQIFFTKSDRFKGIVVAGHHCIFECL
mmetsp:Transcript_8281/g.13712  ORF Transcript_8281/g.13712 Transcript_8281/m.13712 type:complete len:264 (-) Transcript_8281:120-911(-)